MKLSKKLVAYNKAKADYSEVRAVVEGIREVIESIGSIEVSSSITITKDSSERQFIYAVGILSNQVIGCMKLGISRDEYDKQLNNIIQLSRFLKDLKEWQVYMRDLELYEHRIYSLLDNDELFQLIEYPVKK
jgi:hypothetical protein